MNESKLYLFFGQIGKKNMFFGVPQNFTLVYAYHFLNKMENHWFGLKF